MPIKPGKSSYLYKPHTSSTLWRLPQIRSCGFPYIVHTIYPIGRQSQDAHRDQAAREHLCHGSALDQHKDMTPRIRAHSSLIVI